MRAALLFLLLLVGCAADYESAKADLDGATEDFRSLAQGCDWREARAGYEPREPGECYRVHTGPGGRVSLGELADACDAPKLPMCQLVCPGQHLWAYFDRSERDTFEIVRYERSDEPCAD